MTELRRDIITDIVYYYSALLATLLNFISLQVASVKEERGIVQRISDQFLCIRDQRSASVINYNPVTIR